MPPTIVLVHGAFAESASWDGVIDPLVRAGHRVIACANPLRSLAADAAAVSDLVRSIDGPVVLAAHSYGGAVISNVDPNCGAIASHALTVSQPEATTHLILEAAELRVAA
jgi:alpha-beta hydrolase superfamily lysophospholipase